jgi:hypothetical protein
MNKARSLRWIVHEARMEEKTIDYKIIVGNIKEENHLTDLSICWRAILKWTAKR